MFARSRSISTSLGLVITLGWLLFVSVAAYNRQGIIDYWRLSRYRAPAAVQQLAADDTMTDMARRIFYVNAPDITSKQSFSSNCPSGTERTVVLGCYHSNQAGIWVLQVSDVRLNGVEQVTAAHEMLHAAYDRLSASQKRAIDVQLQQYYDHGLTDATVKAQIDDYKRTEPNDVLNEMHSLFGTEIQGLPSGLEQYYKRYFTNRSVITGLYGSYQQEFTSRQDSIKAYDAKLGTMKAQIDSLEDGLKAQQSALHSQQSRLDRLKAGGSIDDYNAAVPAYNRAVDDYNAQVTSLRSTIDSYNVLVRQRNELAAETDQLAAELSNQVPAQ